MRTPAIAVSIFAFTSAICSRLFLKAEFWAKENGICELSLDSSKTAEEFYLKMGFEKAGIAVMHHGGVVFRNCVMKKTI